MHEPKEVARFLEDNEAQKGDTLRLIIDGGINNLIIAAFLVFALSCFYGRSKKRQEEGGEILDNILKGTSVDELENEIESEYGVKIEVQHREDEEFRAWRNLSNQNFQRDLMKMNLSMMI
jgi:hypothetical protein